MIETTEPDNIYEADPSQLMLIPNSGKWEEITVADYIKKVEAGFPESY